MPETQDKPIIGISGASSDSKSVQAMIQKVKDQGGVPVLLSNHDLANPALGGIDKAVEKDMALVDAVIVMGDNFDKDPAKYGQTPHPETKINPSAAREDYEAALIKASMAAKKPLLGICGGHQLINIVEGGTLNQHVPDTIGDDRNMQTDGPATAVQYVGVKEATMLDHIADEVEGLYTPDYVQDHLAAPNMQRDKVNSFHHQAVDKVAEGFVVSATSDGNIVEAIEPDPNGKYADQFILGVQWHPEFLGNALSGKIVDRVIAEGAAYSKAHGRTQLEGIEQQIELRNAISQAPQEDGPATQVVPNIQEVNKPKERGQYNVAP